MTTVAAYRDYVLRAYSPQPQHRKRRIALSPAERDAIAWCQQACSKAGTDEGNAIAATLRGLLKRMGGGG